MPTVSMQSRISPHDADHVLSYGDSLLRRQDVQLLEGPFWLNDQVITFYFEFLWVDQLARSEKVLLVGGAMSYLLNQLAGAGDVSGIVEPLKLSSKDLIMFAVNNNPDSSTPQGGSHWTLLVYFSNMQKFYHYDSAISNGSRSSNDFAAQQIAKAVSPYLGNVQVTVKAAKTPQQINSNDCGLYLLACARIIAREWQQSHVHCRLSSTAALQGQITPHAIARFRQELLEVIKGLAGRS